MSSMLETLIKGGPVMIPIVGLSVLTVTCGLERAWFWQHALQGEKRLVHQILRLAEEDWEKARLVAEQAKGLPIGRFLLAALKLYQPTPETLQLAMVAAGDREFLQMRKCDKLLETVVALAPLLGLLGTVTGLIATFANLNVGGGGANVDLSKASLGIAEALITTAGGMIVAIMALMIFRVCAGLQAAQIDHFSEVGNELELIYRQQWYEPRIVRENEATSNQSLLQEMIGVLRDRLPETAPLMPSPSSFEND